MQKLVKKYKKFSGFLNQKNLSNVYNLSTGFLITILGFKSKSDVLLLNLLNKIVTQKKSRRFLKFIKRYDLISIIEKNTLINIIQMCIDTQKSFPKLYAEIGTYLFNAGQTELAAKCFSESLLLESNLNINSLYLQAIVLSPSSTSEKIMQECIQYTKTYYSILKTAPLAKINNHSRLPSLKSPIKIAYVCHFFQNSVSKSIILPFIAAHNKSRVLIYCYSDCDPSEVNDEIRKTPDFWRDTQNLNDDEFCEQIRKDGIDVLVEMNGHTIINRYGACLQNPAPIQISFYNFAATSGIPSIDYTLVDTKVLNVEEEKFFTEKVYRLPNAYGIASFDNSFPEVSPSPYKKNGYLTFGSFGASHKVNPDTIYLWSQILHAHPTAKFFMKAAALTHEDFRNNFFRAFAKNGIKQDRLIFEGWSNHYEMLKRYAEIDIAIDTTPYNGGTTTLEALWQGVPVLTLCGNRLAARTGKSILTNVGHPEFIGYSIDEVVSISKHLGTNLELLFELRNTLRNKFKDSVLHDAKLFAQDLEDAYYSMIRDL